MGLFDGIVGQPGNTGPNWAGPVMNMMTPPGGVAPTGIGGTAPVSPTGVSGTAPVMPQAPGGPPTPMPGVGGTAPGSVGPLGLGGAGPVGPLGLGDANAMQGNQQGVPAGFLSPGGPQAGFGGGPAGPWQSTGGGGGPAGPWQSTSGGPGGVMSPTGGGPSGLMSPTGGGPTSSPAQNWNHMGVRNWMADGNLFNKAGY